MVGLDDLKGVFQHKWFYDSMILYIPIHGSDKLFFYSQSSKDFI